MEEKHSYEVCLDGNKAWKDCKDSVGVCLSETYVQDYDYEIIYDDKDYDSFTDLEKGTQFIEVGKVHIFAKGDVDKTAVATYALKFRRRYNTIDKFEGGHIISSELDIRDRYISLWAFTDWKTNFGEGKSSDGLWDILPYNSRTYHGYNRAD